MDIVIKEWHRVVSYWDNHDTITITQRWSIDTRHSNWDWKQVFIRAIQNDVWDLIVFGYYRRNGKEIFIWKSDDFSIINEWGEIKTDNDNIHPVIQASFSVPEEVKRLLLSNNN